MNIFDIAEQKKEPKLFLVVLPGLEPGFTA